MDTYFSVRLYMEYIIPLIIIALLGLVYAWYIIRDILKDRLMMRLGYVYIRGLGENVAREFQPHWVKGDIKIHYLQIRVRSLREIKSFVKYTEYEEAN